MGNYQVGNKSYFLVLAETAIALQTNIPQMLLSISQVDVEKQERNKDASENAQRIHFHLSLLPNLIKMSENQLLQYCLLPQPSQETVYKIHAILHFMEAENVKNASENQACCVCLKFWFSFSLHSIQTKKSSIS